MRILPQSTRVARHRWEISRGGLVGDRRAARTLLGEHHQLVNMLAKLQTVVEQLLVVAGIQASSLVLWCDGALLGPPVATAAAAVQITLGCRLALLLQRRRDACVSLIVEGGERLPLAAVELERDRLASLRVRVQLARSIEDLAEAADRRRERSRAPRPIFETRVVRPVVPQLRELARVLRSDVASVRGVALTEQLMTSGTSVLYGTERELLRQELGRARYLLCERSASVADDADNYSRVPPTGRGLP